MNDDLKLLSLLTDEQAFFVLNRLVHADPAIAARAADIAAELLADTDEDAVAEEVCLALTDLDVHDLWRESGGGPDGYVDPYEHSYEMMEDILEPFYDEMDRLFEGDMIDEAFLTAKGLIKGICTYVFEEAGEFADWAPDSEDNLTYDVVERVKQRCQDEDRIAELELFREKCVNQS